MTMERRKRSGVIASIVRSLARTTLPAGLQSTVPGSPMRSLPSVVLVLALSAAAAGDETEVAREAEPRADPAAAFAAWQALADGGDVEAQYRVARIHFLGEGVPQNPREAYLWLRRAALRGHQVAGYLFQAATTRRRKAIRWLERAARDGDAFAQFQLAERLGGTRHGLALYRRAAEQGLGLAQLELGRRHLVGDGVARDEAEAARWLEGAAGVGLVPAFLLLAEVYYEGPPGTRSFARAVRWYRRAAAHGEELALLRLGLMHQEGIGVPRDPVAAWAWFSQRPPGRPLTEQTAVVFRTLRHELERGLSAEQRADAERRAAELRTQLASERGAGQFP